MVEGCGDKVGAPDGIAVGAFDRGKVGATDGIAVGASDGGKVGVTDGIAVGAVLGHDATAQKG